MIQRCVRLKKIVFTQDGTIQMSMQPVVDYGVPVFDMSSYMPGEDPEYYLPIIYVFWNGEIVFDNLKHTAFSKDKSTLYLILAGQGI